MCFALRHQFMHLCKSQNMWRVYSARATVRVVQRSSKLFCLQRLIVNFSGRWSGTCELSKSLLASSQNFKPSRCDEKESLQKAGCTALDIENPRGSVSIDKNKPVTNRNGGEKLRPEEITQIQPQKLTLNLRSGTGPHQ